MGITHWANVLATAPSKARILVDEGIFSFGAL